MAFVKNWDESSPPDTGESPSLGAQRIRDFKQAIRERLAEDHKFVSDETGESNIGKHKRVRLIKQTSDELAETDIGVLYTKSISGVTELFWRDDSGNIKQLTTGGKLNVVEAEIPDVFVKLTTAQTIAGVKTFSDYPKIETYTAPTADEEFAPKKYVDDASAPDYDSGWFAVTKDTVYKLSHGLGQKPINVVLLFDINSDGSGKNFLWEFHYDGVYKGLEGLGFDDTYIYFHTASGYIEPSGAGVVDSNYGDLTDGYCRVLAWK